ncbi:MAG TPA: hypothetical protein VME66_05130 [Candidatus Acidoferrales bacterium]|nr:hypothetical protein [Candidatus Acidoferrales bacterium]
MIGAREAQEGRAGLRETFDVNNEHFTNLRVLMATAQPPFKDASAPKLSSPHISHA